MILQSDISKILLLLEQLYNDPEFSKIDPKWPKLVSKLAILEVCGWIEESMDYIIRNCANRHLKMSVNQDYIEKTVIKLTHTFNYEKFRDMLIKTIGIIKVEELENSIDSRKFHIMKSVLGSLKVDRDKHAHKHLKETTSQIAAPSKTKDNFSKVYDGLEEIDNKLIQLKL